MEEEQRQIAKKKFQKLVEKGKQNSRKMGLDDLNNKDDPEIEEKR